MKIGILTFHYAINYGAVYQALGLQEELKRQGHEPEFINYVPPYMRGRNSFFRGWGLKSGRLFKVIAGHKLDKERKKGHFRKFIDQVFQVSPHIKTQDALTNYCKQYDAIIVGSDQVWNLNWFKHFDGTYFLDFLTSVKGRPRRIAYAPCFGVKQQPADMFSQALPYLNRFDCIAVRNELSARILKDAGIEKIERVVDPAFLCSRKMQSKGMAKNICIYLVNARVAKQCNEYAKIASSVLGKPVVNIKGESVIFEKETAFEYINSASPDEWFKQMSDAALIITESFHGVVFAISHKIPFLVVENGDRSERIIDLLKKYDFMDRFLTACPDQLHEIANIITCAPHSDLLDQDIRLSKRFLESALA
jgi:polysaccharide pyruvyl transferase WcaK-like protein